MILELILTAHPRLGGSKGNSVTEWKLRTVRIIEDTEEGEFRIIVKNCLYLSYYFQGGRQGLNRESRHYIVNMRAIACSDLNFQWWL